MKNKEDNHHIECPTDVLWTVGWIRGENGWIDNSAARNKSCITDFPYIVCFYIYKPIRHNALNDI